MGGPFGQAIASLQREIINPLITLIALAAFVLFIYGVVEFIRNGDNEEKRRVGQQHMIWGVIGLVIVFGAQAIVRVLMATVQ